MINHKVLTCRVLDEVHDRLDGPGVRLTIKGVKNVHPCPHKTRTVERKWYDGRGINVVSRR